LGVPSDIIFKISKDKMSEKSLLMASWTWMALWSKKTLCMKENDSRIELFFCVIDTNLPSSSTKYYVCSMYLYFGECFVNVLLKFWLFTPSVLNPTPPVLNPRSAPVIIVWKFQPFKFI